MFAFLSENWGSILIGIFLLFLVVIVIRKLVHDKKQGKSSCGCGCSHCPNAAMCHSHATAPKKK